MQRRTPALPPVRAGAPARAAALVAALLATALAATGCGPHSGVAAPRPAPTATSSNPSASPSRTTAPGVPDGPSAPGGSPDGPAGSLRETGTQDVALTFDDGPDPVTTPKLLALLRQYHVHATFCVIGSRARDYPDLIQAIVADGHTLCNHSWQHLQDLAKRPWSYQNWDLMQTNLAIQKAVPGAQINFFRAPGGAFTPALVKLIKEQHMRPLYWDVDPRDWDNPTYGTGPSMVNQIITTVEKQVHPGSVILSHDRAQHPDTVTAYETLLPWLLARYKLVPLY
jgi:peptidoglycan/xylan/chitin deacetylase (PgdA/CDA1 family)